MASSIDGTPMPKEPISVVWSKKVTGTRGDRRPIHSGYHDVELRFPNLTANEYEFFFDELESDAFHTIVLTSPDDQTETTYTGSVIISVSGEEQDIPGFFFNVSMQLNLAR